MQSTSLRSLKSLNRDETRWGSDTIRYKAYQTGDVMALLLPLVCEFWW